MPTTDTTLLEQRIRACEADLVCLLAQWEPVRAGKWDKRDTWDNKTGGGGFDNRPGWDNWDKRKR